MKLWQMLTNYRDAEGLNMSKNGQKFIDEVRDMEERAAVLEKAFHASEELGRREIARAEAAEAKWKALDHENDALCEKLAVARTALVDEKAAHAHALRVQDGLDAEVARLRECVETMTANEKAIVPHLHALRAKLERVRAKALAAQNNAIAYIDNLVPASDILEIIGSAGEETR